MPVSNSNTTTVTYDILELVESMEPDRDEPTLEYDFPARRFYRVAGTDGIYD